MHCNKALPQHVAIHKNNKKVKIMFSFVALYYIEKLSSSGNIGCIETIAASVI